jgi:hypothetical protein
MLNKSLKLPVANKGFVKPFMDDKHLDIKSVDYESIIDVLDTSSKGMNHVYNFYNKISKEVINDYEEFLKLKMLNQNPLDLIKKITLEDMKKNGKIDI